MNSYYIKQASRTIGSVVIAGLIASQAVSSAGDDQQTESKKTALKPEVYYSGVTPKSYTTYGNFITGEYYQIRYNFEESVSNFYAKLLSNQEPLGADFEKVLYDNLWDLYES